MWVHLRSSPKVSTYPFASIFPIASLVEVTSENRHLSITIGLNNEFEGGEFVFDLGNEKHQFPQNVGDCIIFPSNFMFPHSVNQITSGTRYALIGWVI